MNAAVVEHAPKSKMELFGQIYGFLLFLPWFFVLQNNDFGAALAIDAILVALPIGAFVSFYAFVFTLHFTVKTISCAWTQGQGRAVAVVNPMDNLSPGDRRFAEACIRRNAEIDADTWTDAKEDDHNAIFKAELAENEYMEASLHRRRCIEMMTWTKDDEIAFNKRFLAFE